MSQPARVVLAIGGAIALLIVIAVVAVLALEREQQPSYPPGSPEAALVDYLDALEAGDADRVYALLSQSAREEVERREKEGVGYSFRQEIRYARDSLRDARVRITRVDRRDDQATLTLTIDRFSSSGPGFPPFPSGERYSYERTIDLVLEDGSWKVDEPLVYL
ncbi:hypothetical protein HRbin26_00911 [bacterium HR26]|nr:hypothetical protein HRbin26_00911 [bacterium HR26]